jgi:hypothetical protein
MAISLTTVVALYAAAIASGGLAVQLVREWRTWGTRISVTMRPMTLSHPPTPLTERIDEPVVMFHITNHSDHAAKVTHLSVEPINSSGKSLWFPQPLPSGTPGPHEIPPHDSITLYQPRYSFKDGDPTYKTRAVVSTSDGRSARSKRLSVREILEYAA